MSKITPIENSVSNLQALKGVFFLFYLQSKMIFNYLITRV
jgi:hypothetical protein